MPRGAAEGLHGRCGGTTRVTAEGDEVVAAERRHYTGAAEGDATKWWAAEGLLAWGSSRGAGAAGVAATRAVMQ